MHGGVSDPSICAFIHRVAFEEVSGHRVLMKSGLGNRGRSAFGSTHVGCLEFPHETGLILRCAAKVMKLFQTKQRNRPSCGDQEGRSGSDEVLLGTSVFPSSETGMSGSFWGRIKRSSTVSLLKMESSTSLGVLQRARASFWNDCGTTWFFSSCGGIFELPQGIHASSCVGPQKSYLPFEIRGIAGCAL